MALIISLGFAAVLLLVTFIFGLFTRQNIVWVALSLIWGAVGYGLVYVINPKVLEMGLNIQLMAILLFPAIQQILVSLGTLSIIYWLKFDNLVDGAVYGFAMGIGYAIFKSLEFVTTNFETIAISVFSTTLVLGIASGIIGVVVSQFYFQQKPRKTGILFGGLALGIAYTALFNYLVKNGLGGNTLQIAFGIGGITLVGLYVTGQLRNIIMRLAVEKGRADGLLDIVIPIGVNLTREKEFQKLLETVLVEAKNFCHADAGALYLRKEDSLKVEVLRNDSLNLALGGTSGVAIQQHPIRLYNEKTGKPNSQIITAHAALTGKTINIPDSYKDIEYDFSEIERFDEQHHYASVSFLIIPLKSTQGYVLGVLQLLNAQDPKKRRLIPFDANLQQLMESFSSLATAALEGYLHEEALRNEILQLRIEIDAAKRKKQVDEITNSDYFKELKQKTQELKDKKDD